MTGEAADTPRRPPLRRDGLGEEQLASLTRHKRWLGGVGPGPPRALPLHPGCTGRQPTARPFGEPAPHSLATGAKANVKKEASTALSPHWVQRLLLHKPSILVCYNGLCAADGNCPENAALRVGLCCIPAEAAARLWERT